MFTTNTIVRPLTSADSEYSVCGYSVLRKAKVIETFARKENGNNIKIEILDHINPNQIGKKYTVDDRYFEAIVPDWIWIDAYKGTDANMRCLGKQYRMGVEDVYGDKVVLGSKGYHACTKLEHCFKNYDYDFKNRFFKVKILVETKYVGLDGEYINPNNTTIVGKAIKFVEEITDAPTTIAAKRNSVR